MTDATYDIVCVGAHPDDVEIGMGGTVALSTEAGRRVLIVDLTDGEPTPCGTPEIRAAESSAAAAALGADRRTLTLPNRYLFDGVEQREALATVLREARPRMLFLPYPVDAHPDHVAAARIGMAARFYGKFTKTAMPGEPHYVPRVFSYMAVHQRIIAQPSFIIDIGPVLSRKREALEAYRSQFVDNPANSAVIDSVQAAAGMWGALANIAVGEPFFALETVALGSLDSVL